jgi:hypothetical protein
MVIVYFILGGIGAYGVYEAIPKTYNAINIVYIAFTKPETLSPQIPNLVEAATMRLGVEFGLLLTFLLLTIWSIKKIFAPLGKVVVEAEKKKKDSLHVSETEANKQTNSIGKD